MQTFLFFIFLTYKIKCSDKPNQISTNHPSSGKNLKNDSCNSIAQSFTDSKKPHRENNTHWSTSLFGVTQHKHNTQISKPDILNKTINFSSEVMNNMPCAMNFVDSYCRLNNEKNPETNSYTKIPTLNTFPFYQTDYIKDSYSSGLQDNDCFMNLPSVTAQDIQNIYDSHNQISTSADLFIKYNSETNNEIYDTKRHQLMSDSILKQKRHEFHGRNLSEQLPHQVSFDRNSFGENRISPKEQRRDQTNRKNNTDCIDGVQKDLFSRSEIETHGLEIDRNMGYCCEKSISTSKNVDLSILIQSFKEYSDYFCKRLIHESDFYNLSLESKILLNEIFIKIQKTYASLHNLFRSSMNYEKNGSGLVDIHKIKTNSTDQSMPFVFSDAQRCADVDDNSKRSSILTSGFKHCDHMNVKITNEHQYGVFYQESNVGLQSTQPSMKKTCCSKYEMDKPIENQFTHENFKSYSEASNLDFLDHQKKKQTDTIPSNQLEPTTSLNSDFAIGIFDKNQGFDDSSTSYWDDFPNFMLEYHKNSFNTSLFHNGNLKDHFWNHVLFFVDKFLKKHFFDEIKSDPSKSIRSFTFKSSKRSLEIEYFLSCLFREQEKTFIVPLIAIYSYLLDEIETKFGFKLCFDLGLQNWFDRTYKNALSTDKTMNMILTRDDDKYIGMWKAPFNKGWYVRNFASLIHWYSEENTTSKIISCMFSYYLTKNSKIFNISKEKIVFKVDFKHLNISITEFLHTPLTYDTFVDSNTSLTIINSTFWLFHINLIDIKKIRNILKSSKSSLELMIKLYNFSQKIFKEITLYIQKSHTENKNTITDANTYFFKTIDLPLSSLIWKDVNVINVTLSSHEVKEIKGCYNFVIRVFFSLLKLLFRFRNIRYDQQTSNKFYCPNDISESLPNKLLYFFDRQMKTIIRDFVKCVDTKYSPFYSKTEIKNACDFIFKINQDTEFIYTQSSDSIILNLNLLKKYSTKKKIKIILNYSIDTLSTKTLLKIEDMSVLYRYPFYMDSLQNRILEYFKSNSFDFSSDMLNKSIS